MGRTIFGQVFVKEGMSNFQNSRVPPTGGSRLPHAHPGSFEMRCTVPVPILGHLQDADTLRKLPSHLPLGRAVDLRSAELHALSDGAQPDVEALIA